MAVSVIMPALEMAQETGTLLRWLKGDGELVTKGEPLMEIETDKVTVEIEAPASGILGGILAKEGDVVPVGQTIAWILAPGETLPTNAAPALSGQTASQGQASASTPGHGHAQETTLTIQATPLARRMAEEHGIDLAQIRHDGKRIEKADVEAYLRQQEQASREADVQALETRPRLVPASPKARRLAHERGLDLALIRGSGPEGAVVSADVLAAAKAPEEESTFESVGTTWRIMAERMLSSWTSVPHFYLVREVDASSLIQWRQQITPIVERRSGIKPTYTDLLVKLLGFALRNHPRLNSTWANGSILHHQEINVGIATAIDEGLIVPVIRGADSASISQIATQRHDLVERAKKRALRPQDITGGTFTLSNLGMYNVDAFNAIINAPQAAILAVGRIAERVVAVNGQVVIRPMMVLTLSCDHRLVDGARAALFLDELAGLINDPWALLA